MIFLNKISSEITGLENRLNNLSLWLEIWEIVKHFFSKWKAMINKFKRFKCSLEVKEYII